MISFLKKFKFADECTIETAIYFCIGLLFFSLPLSESLKQLSFWLLLLLFFFYKKRYQENIFILDTINIFIYIHLFSCIIGSFIGVDTFESLKKSIDILKMVLLFIMLREVKIRKNILDILLKIIFLSFSIATIIGMYKYFLSTEDFIKLHSVGSINRSAVYAVFIFSISSVYWIKHKDFLSLFGLIMSSLYILLAGSRMALFSFPLLIIILLFLDKRFTFKTLFLIAFSSLLCIISILYFFEGSRVANKILLGLQDPARIQIWVSSIHIWLSHNLFFGIGIGNSTHFNVEDFYGEYALTTFIDNAHNTYLSLLLEQGIIGLLSYLLFLFFIFKALIQRTDYLAKIGILLISATLIMSFMNITFRYEFGLLFMALLGFIFNKSFYENETSNVYIKSK